MAYSSWAHPSQNSGSGTADVSWSGDLNTGRNQRSTSPKFTAASCNDVPISVNQAGKPEFVEQDDTGSIAKSGATLTVHGTANSSKLTFSLANNNIGLTLPANYTAAGASTANGVAIAGDPGAAAQFNFSITFANPGANPGTTARTTQLIVTDAAGHTDTCLITQAAGDAYLTVSPTTVELDWEGNPVTIHVESNTSWSIS